MRTASLCAVFAAAFARFSAVADIEALASMNVTENVATSPVIEESHQPGKKPHPRPDNSHRRPNGGRRDRRFNPRLNNPATELNEREACEQFADQYPLLEIDCSKIETAEERARREFYDDHPIFDIKESRQPGKKPHPRPDNSHRRPRRFAEEVNAEERI